MISNFNSEFMGSWVSNWIDQGKKALGLNTSTGIGDLPVGTMAAQAGQQAIANISSQRNAQTSAAQGAGTTSSIMSIAKNPMVLAAIGGIVLLLVLKKKK